MSALWTAYQIAPLPRLFLIFFVPSLASPLCVVVLPVGLTPLIDGLIVWVWRCSFLVHRKINILWSEPLLPGALRCSSVHHIAKKVARRQTSPRSHFYTLPAGLLFLTAPACG